MDVRENASGATGMQQRRKGPRPKGAITSGKQGKGWRDLQGASRTGDRRVSQVSQDSKNECHDITKGSATSETIEETTYNGVRAGDVRALTTLGTSARTDQKSGVIVIHLDRLAPYERAAGAVGE
jgi:hypothetical protein